MNEFQQSLRKQEENNETCSISWLGQAGFIISTGKAKLAIDLYLSDYLAKKYAGMELPHRRMAPPPMQPESLNGMDLYFCTHQHSDHMDPETFPIVMRNNPCCRAVVPAAHAEHAAGLGVDPGRIVPIDAGENTAFPELGIEIHALAAAHEKFEQDREGRHLYLGYIITSGADRFYHSGDCVPYDGLTDELKKFSPRTALLPVNGRDEYRRSRNILGNFTIEEAIQICREAEIQHLIPHHFGMFDFNTVDLDYVQNAASKEMEKKVTIHIPALGESLPCTA